MISLIFNELFGIRTVLVFHGLTRHRMEEISNYPLSCAREFSCVVGGQHLERQRAKKTVAHLQATMSFLSKETNRGTRES